MRIHYICEYNSVDDSRTLSFSPAGISKMNYIIDVLSSYDIPLTVFSTSRTLAKGCFKRKKLFYKNVDFVYRSTFFAKRCLHKCFERWYAIFQLVRYLLFSVKKGDVVVAYHERYYQPWISKISKLKGFAFIYEVEELYTVAANLSSKYFQGARKSIVGFNVGSWSTKTALPQGIIEDRKNGGFTMFQIENNNCWYYEIGVRDGRYYLTLSGASLTYGGNSKKLSPSQSYVTPTVALAFDKTLNGVLESITKYRRHIAGKCTADKNLPTIFNEYMHLSWDSPTAETTLKYAPTVAKTGVEYYVIDCGWHDEVDGNIIYPYVGKWIESNKRFPNGVKATADYIHSLGMKFGLWIEPEIIGVKCAEMLSYYEDDCFLQRNGKKIAVAGRYFLDFRDKKVRKYLTQTINRMVNEYGAEYIKFDYNQDCGVGTDYDAFTVGEGLENACKAYLSWVREIREKFPQVIFETCSSGGMRMDYKTLSHFSIVSTSDQTNYKRYPYVIANMLSAVLPEQSAVWSYPVDSFEEFGTEYTPTKEWVEKNITTEQVIFNMTNSFLGRMHLASHLELLSQEKFDLVKEGINYYNYISSEKLTAIPYMPLGFTEYGAPFTASGMISGKKLYLVVWNLSKPAKRVITLDGIKTKSAKIAYPSCNALKYSLRKNKITIKFTKNYQARMFEIELV